MLFSFKLENNEDETTVKALFIYNFTKHIEWPKGKINGKFMIGVLGNSPVFEKLSSILKDRKIKDLPVEIKRIAGNDQVESCDILFIAKAESDRFKDINEKSDCYGVLIITEEKDMAKKGSCINIIRQDERMKFEINDSAVRKEGLKVSSQLYELAVIVK
jgi:hypothetical protein